MSRKKTEQSRPSVSLANYGSYDEKEIIGTYLIRQIRNARSVKTDEQIGPCVVLWTDPERLWEGIIEELTSEIPELYVLGDYSPDKRTGPAIWLKCVEAQTVQIYHPKDVVPIFYLPGVSRQELRDAETCPLELRPLVEYLYRGSDWHHPNGRDWTPIAFLSSDQGGLSLDIVKGEAVREAIQRALPVILTRRIGELNKDRIDVDFVNHLLTPDFPREILAWMSAPHVVKKGKGKEGWTSFCDQLEKEYGIHPEKDGEHRAAQLLAQRDDGWADVWERFKESPNKHEKIIKLLEQVDPPEGQETRSNLEPYVRFNDAQERELSEALLSLKDKGRGEVLSTLSELDKIHGMRRAWVWATMRRAQMTVALEHLIKLGQLTEKPLNASKAIDLAELYASEGWKVDAELLYVAACCSTREQEGPVRAVSQALYIDWLDRSSRNLQELIKREGSRIAPRLDPIQAENGRIILFVDGLRFDVAQLLLISLSGKGKNVKMEWDWSPYPSITQTSKPYVSPINHLLNGDPSSTDLNPRMEKTGQSLSSDRFSVLLKQNEIQVINNSSIGDSLGKAWTESGTIDQLGHNEEWRLGLWIKREVEDLALRVCELLDGAWKEVIVVTDHGWLLAPICLPAIALPKHLTDMKWGRCAIMKGTVTTELPTVPWYWNDLVQVASPPGAGCFRANTCYSHGGISPQEIMVPRITVSSDHAALQTSKIIKHSWIGMRCVVVVDYHTKEVMVDIRTRLQDSTSSLIEGGKPRVINSDGTISLPIADPDDEGKKSFIVLVDEKNKILHSVPTKIGG